jgi:hypothetical protein
MGFFERRTPRGFQHHSRFHDERKERLRILERNESVDEIPFNNNDKYRERLRENWDLRRKRSAGMSEGFLKRFLISVVVLIAIFVLAGIYLS